MQDPLITLTLAVAALTGLAIVAATALRGWNGWLDLKRAELARGSDDAAPPSTATRIEVADLKERIRKLEAIAAGVDL
ncbi:hypothetical protein EWH08_09215 [Sphingobium indicum]|uniref:Uncharacterized protein n=2 Tax=Sphingobium indicum TaxID=332055 RepID=A0A1L5BST6_SPHIB|nr:hypothetical protein [Sphingobium indicum]APL95936.1 hypothetical protein SIDU_16260 [Sphingobium indicum B90A]KEY99197.1 hypothetical protein AI27_06110 [Sphingomonas sp. BHC-A]NYI22640.1 hypothetical protein [Sphingobium indicum]RYM02383.1 hypothetical protein EWH08_09215 [Sphingobium indicum]